MAASNLNLGKASGGVLNIQPADGTTTTSLVLPAINGTVVAADSNGNVGIGVTPYSSTGIGKSIDINTNGAISADTVGVNITNNQYYSNGWKYKLSGYALQYEQNLTTGVHRWYNSTSGTAGGIVSPITAMTLDANGNVGIGTSSPTSPLTVKTSSSYLTQDYLGDSTNGWVGIRFRNSGNTATTCFHNYDNGSYKIGTVGTDSVQLWTNNNERMRIDANGNVGIGITPSAWYTGAKAQQIGSQGSVFQDQNNSVGIGKNIYKTGTSTYNYIASDYASLYYQSASQHQWLTAEVGTAGNVISWTSAMTFDSSGNLGVCVTPATRLDVNGVSRIRRQNDLTTYLDITVTDVNVNYNGYDPDGYMSHQWSSNGSTKMLLSGSGVLTLSPSNTSGVQDGLVLYDPGSGVSEGIKIKWSSLNYSNIAAIYGSSNYGLYFQVGGLDKMLLDTNGNFDVLGSINCGYNGTSYGASGSSSLVAYGGDGSSYTQVVGRNTSGSSIVFYSVVAGVNKSAILSNGNFQSATNSYGSTSDAKLKENVQDASPKLDKLMKVQVRTFNYIGQEDKQIGVVAQEIEKIFPSIVYETKDTKQVQVEKEREITLEDGTVDIEKYTEMETIETGEVTKNVKYSVIYMMMLKAMQEQNEIIKDLKSRIEILEAK